MRRFFFSLTIYQIFDTLLLRSNGKKAAAAATTAVVAVARTAGATRDTHTPLDSSRQSAEPVVRIVFCVRAHSAVRLKI